MLKFDGDIPQVLTKLVEAAAMLIEQGITDRAANVLAYVLRHNATPATAFAQADDLFDDLEAEICPRMIVDAKDWASTATLDDAINQLRLAMDEADIFR